MQNRRRGFGDIVTPEGYFQHGQVRSTPPPGIDAPQQYDGIAGQISEMLDRKIADFMSQLQSTSLPSRQPVYQFPSCSSDYVDSCLAVTVLPGLTWTNVALYPRGMVQPFMYFVVSAIGIDITSPAPAPWGPNVITRFTLGGQPVNEYEHMQYQFATTLNPLPFKKILTPGQSFGIDMQNVTLANIDVVARIRGWKVPSLAAQGSPQCEFKKE